MIPSTGIEQLVTLLFISGLLSATVLVPLLARTVAVPSARFWPPAREGSPRSLFFWGPFRVLNVSTFALAVFDAGEFIGLPQPIRVFGLIFAAACCLLYVHSCMSLGRSNTYCQRDGLVTTGIYRWTRNPQYATAIPAFLGLAVAADSWRVAVLTAALVTTYTLMALAEEPWLRQVYGDAYVRYARRVPRFFNWRRVATLGGLLFRRARLPCARCGPRGSARHERPELSGAATLSLISLLSHSRNLNLF